MRSIGTILGWLMLLAGIGFLIFGGLATNSTASGSNALTAAERSGFWSCQAVDGGRQDCHYAGASPGALQANPSPVS